MADKNIRRGEAANALRSVTPDEAFYFYREIGQPLGAASKSLDEFATIVKDIDPSSVRFHIERGDFDRWFRMLGDESLVDQVAALRGENISPDELRGRVNSMVRTRIDQLHEIASSPLRVENRDAEYEAEREKEHEGEETEKEEEENQEDEKEDREEWEKEEEYSIETPEEKEEEEREEDEE